MSILLAKVTIKGIKTLAWHHFSHHALPLEQQERTGVAGHDPIEWTRTVLMNEERELFLPPTYFFGCLKGGGKYVKKGRGSILYDVASTLQIVDEQIYMMNNSSCLKVPEEPEVIDAFSRSVNKLPDVYIERIGVRNPTTKARNIRYRIAAKPGWHCTFSILWDAVVVNRNQMESVVINAGRLVGIGDGRGSIGYGRFEVEAFDVVEDKY